MPRRDKPTALSKALGARIKHLREELGMTQEKLAYVNDVSKGFLSDIEHGLALPTLETLEILADGLGVDLLDLFTFPEKGPRHKLVDRSRGLSAAKVRKLASEIPED